MIGRPGRHRPRTLGQDSPTPQGGTASLFVSILVRYPEVASVSYSRDAHSLRLSVLVSRSVGPDSAGQLRDLLRKSIRAYCRLVNREVRVFDLEVKAARAVSVVEIWRDLESLTRDELSMTLAIIQGFFGPSLVVDQFPHVGGEELAVQEQLIEEMLEGLRDAREARREPNLIAFRDEGRVLVYSR